MNGSRKRGVYLQWNIIQPGKGKYCYMQKLQMNLENVVLNERSQTHKNKYHMISLIVGV